MKYGYICPTCFRKESTLDSVLDLSELKIRRRDEDYADLSCPRCNTVIGWLKLDE